MKRVIYSTILFILISLTSISVVYAKGSADKISISGPGLTNPVDITDQQILQQFSPWGDYFFDIQKGALTIAPKTNSIYQVLIYSKDNNNQLQVRYAFQYAPGQPGYIYVPGEGDPWYKVNIGTVSRGSTIEGHWFYASKEWGDLMKRLLAGKSLSFTKSPQRSVSTILSSQVGLLGLGVVVILSGFLIWVFRRGRGKIV